MKPYVTFWKIECKCSYNTGKNLKQYQKMLFWNTAKLIGKLQENFEKFSASIKLTSNNHRLVFILRGASEVISPVNFHALASMEFQ